MYFFGNFFGRRFLGGILGRNFFGGVLLEKFFWEEFFVYIVKVIVKVMEGIDLFAKILVFIKILSQCTRKEEFQSLEVRAQANRT